MGDRGTRLVAAVQGYRNLYRRSSIELIVLSYANTGQD
jgi:hypothetical protein